MNDRDATRRTQSEPRPASGAPAETVVAPARKVPRKSNRESIESFVVVFLAFLIWSIEAEGFVIPTGSMAPTLMGRHKEITCPECGYVYTVNAYREVDSDDNGPAEGPRIHWATCENCRFEAVVNAAPSFSGDRIYVMKDGVSIPFLPQAGRVRLDRWDVAVFKLPEKPEVRYIKRLVGMPDEVLRIQGGDVWVKPQDDSADFERALRPLEHQQAMQMMVYDDRHRAASLGGESTYARWSAEGLRDWTEPEPGTFVPDPTSPDWSEVRYRHIVPSPEDGRSFRPGHQPESPVRKTLITDYLSYNTDLTAWDRRGGWDVRLTSSKHDGRDISTEDEYLIVVAAVDRVLHFRMFDGDARKIVDIDEKHLTEKARKIDQLRDQIKGLWPPHELTEAEKVGVIEAVRAILGPNHRDPRPSSRSWLQPHWVGDLTVSLKLTVREPAGRLRLELIKGGVSNRCEIDLVSGEARLFHGDDALGTSATTRVAGPGTYDLTLANVDGRLTLWVDRDLPFGEGRSYPTSLEPDLPTQDDLEPARIASRNAEIAIGDLILKRDIYYTLDPSEPDFANLGEAARSEPSALFELLSDPERFAMLSHRALGISGSHRGIT